MPQNLTQDHTARLACMQDLQAAARRITLPLFAQDISAENKAVTGYDPVTEADTRAEDTLRLIIQSTFPDDSIHGEEFEDVTGTSDWLWTLDPIDGTRGFIAGVPVWSTLIAVSYKEAPCLGLMDFPALDTAYWGQPGKAWKQTNTEKNPITSRVCPKLEDAVLGCTEPLSMLNEAQLTAYNIVRRTARFSRLGLDAFGYGLVAEGRMDVIIEADLKPCDVRALIPVVEGAGGKVTDWQGGSAINGGAVVAVGNPALLPELYDILGSAL